jgi:tRNA threonylcarbamoyladenosine biosynthesis protein TsaB
VCRSGQPRYNNAMSIIIAIETSTELASVALLRHEDCFIRESAGVLTHSQSVLPMVQAMLKEAGLRLADCEAIAFGCGPGSFTGVRTACGITQGLAFASGLPVVPVVTLQAMAQACHDLHGTNEVVALLDARMEEVYWAQYRFDTRWQTVVEPALAAPAAVNPVGRVAACGNGLAAYSAAFENHEFAEKIDDIPGPHALYVARLARQAYARGEAVEAKFAQPLYLRNKVALTTAERQAKFAV